MPKINHNGIIRDMTPKEAIEYKHIREDMPLPPVDPLEAIQAQLDENTLAIAEMMYG